MIYRDFMVINRYLNTVFNMIYKDFMVIKRDSLQTPRLPASDPAYPLTCSNPCVGLALFFYFPKPKTLKA